MPLEATFFGVLQGITEWLPISSQGNLLLLMIGFFNYTAESAIRLSIFLHAGTLLAAVVYFRKELAAIAKGLRRYRFGFSSELNGLITFLILSSGVTGMVGYPLFKSISLSPLSGETLIVLIGIALIITGIVQKISKIINIKSIKDLRFKDSILLGVVQGFSVIPGISRSGITVSSFLLRGYAAADALKLSFLMSIPTVLVAQIGLGVVGGLGSLNIQDVFVGIAFSFVAGLLSIHTLLKLAARVRFWSFTILIGVIAIIPFVAYL